MVQGSSIMNLEMTRNQKPLDLCDLTTQNIQINASYIESESEKYQTNKNTWKLLLKLVPSLGLISKAWLMILWERAEDLTDRLKIDDFTIFPLFP